VSNERTSDLNVGRRLQDLEEQCREMAAHIALLITAVERLNPPIIVPGNSQTDRWFKP